MLRSDICATECSRSFPLEVPAELATKCRRLYRWHGTDVELIDIKRPVEQQVTQLPWASELAEKEYLDFARMVDDRIDQDPALRPFFARAAETAIRLATIRAAGRGFPPRKSRSKTCTGARASPGSPGNSCTSGPKASPP